MRDVIERVGVTPDIPPAEHSPFVQPRQLPTWALPVGVFVVAVALWQAVSTAFSIPNYLVPSPATIVAAFAKDPSLYIQATWVTGAEAMIGLGAAIVLGLALAIVIAHWRLLDRIVTPYLVLLQVTPTIAIAPLLTIWFGYDLTPKVVTAFLTSFFPIVITTAVGLRSADRDVLDLLTVLSAPKSFIFWRAKVHFALPHFLASLKVAVPGAVIGAIIGEFISSTEGLGYVIMTAQSALDTARLFVAILGSAVLGIVAFAATTLVERKALHWHESQLEGG